MTSAVLLGSGVGLGLGAAYLAGGMARATTDHQRAARLAEAAAGGFSEAVLQREAAAMDPGVLRIARRHDPFTVAGDAERDRQSAIIAARLEQRGGRNQPRAVVMRASYAGPSVAPFRLAGVLESSRELECLTQAVYFEARGEGSSGQQAVAQVVLNRVRNPAYPKSVCGVVFQGAARARGCQFSFACDGSMRRGRETTAWTRAKQIAERALSGAVMASVGDATNFHTIQVSPSWGPRMVRVAQVGTHVFYRFGRGATPATYVADSRAGREALNSAPVLYTSLESTSDQGPIALAPDFRLASAVVTSAPAEHPAGLGTAATAPSATDAKARAKTETTGAPKAKIEKAPKVEPKAEAQKAEAPKAKVIPVNHVRSPETLAVSSGAASS